MEIAMDGQKDPYEVGIQNPQLPLAFLHRRWQSFAGFFLVLFLFEHLLTNSQAALFIGDDGKGFIESVNLIHSLPYLQVIEITLLALPFLIHGLWGIKYLLQGSINSVKTQGTTPSLSKYSRNHGYTWQRITSILLLFAIIAHVSYMRFIKKPHEVRTNQGDEYFVKVSDDEGLYTLSDRLKFDIFTHKQIQSKDQSFKRHKTLFRDLSIAKKEMSMFFSQNAERQRQEKQRLKQEKKILKALNGYDIRENQVVLQTSSPGTAILMVVRDTFKSTSLCILYSLFVFIACFHACNGLWTFSISWGITLTEHSMKRCRQCCNVLMGVLIFFGLISIWGTYWINLRN